MVQDVLAGRLLFVSWQEIAAFAPLYVIAFVVWFVCPKVREGAGFFIIFAVVVTASVQFAGVYVVFASLILPALTVSTLNSKPVRWAVLSGWTAVPVGVLISVWTDMPVGPLIVFVYAAVMILVRGGVSLHRA